MYHQFNIQQFYILLTQCIYVFCVDLRKKKKTAIISPYNINVLVFITVERLQRGTDWIFLTLSTVNLSIRSTIRAVSRRTVTAEARFRSQVSLTFVVDRVALGQVFMPVLRFSPVSIVPPMLHTQLHPACCSYQHKQTKPGNLSKQQCSFGNWVNVG